MDNRLYFILGDVVANVFTGLVVGLLCYFIVGVSWNMWLAMLLMMVVGMLVGLVLFFPLGIFFGAMEVMMPLMLSSMLSGMVVGMWIPMAPLLLPEAAIIGAFSGLAGLVAVWILNSVARGKVVLVEEG